MVTSAAATIQVRRTNSGFRALKARIEGNAESFAYNFARRATSRIRMLAPVDTGYLKSKVVWERNDKHDFTVKVDGDTQTETGAYYGIYVEYGTRHMAAQPFFRPGVEQAIVEFKREMKGVFR